MTDANYMLSEIRKLYEIVQTGVIPDQHLIAEDGDDAFTAVAERLGELVQELDEHMLQGKPGPAEWRAVGYEAQIPPWKSPHDPGGN